MSTRTASRSRTGRHTGFREGQISFFPCELNASERPIDLLHGGCGKGDWKQRPKAPPGRPSAFSTHFKRTAAALLRASQPGSSHASLFSTRHRTLCPSRTQEGLHHKYTFSFASQPRRTHTHSKTAKAPFSAPISHILLSFPSITSFGAHSSKTLIQILVFYQRGMS